MTNSLNFNIENTGKYYPNANSLKVGSEFKYIGNAYVVEKFLKEHIVTTAGRKFYYVDFENWVNMEMINLNA